MTSAPNPSVSRRKAEPHERYVAAARLLLMWERVWPALWPATGIVGLYAAAALFGLLDPLAGVLRSLLLLGVLAAAGYALHRSFRSWRTPSWQEAARRVEHDSLLEHRPITERHDRVAAGAGDPFAELLWRAHATQLLRRLTRLRLALPQPGLAARDPHQLRFLVLLLLAGGLLFAGADGQRRLFHALTFDEGGGAPAAVLDAWITPPAYTGWAPLYLRAGANAEVTVPAGSELVLRVHGQGTTPRLVLQPAPRGGVPEFGATSGGASGSTSEGNSGSWGASARLAADTRIEVLEAGHPLGRWRIRAIPDQPPVIAFAAPPSRTERDALKLSFTAGDDYGVVAVHARIRPLSRNSHATLSVELPLAEASAKTVTETVYRDLTAHPFAGLDVEIVLEAKDGAGQVGRSAPMHMRLPERVFVNPLARALVEQRQTLALEGQDARMRATRALDALAIAPERFYAGAPAVYLGLRTAYWSLRAARHAEDIARVQDLLWQMAMALEQGGLSDAAERLRQLQQLLSQALARDAPQSEIDALLQRYREALQHYLQALAQKGERANGPLPPNAKVMKSEDLDAMLKAIQQLAQTGARGKAAEMLALLQNMLENMHVGTGSGGSGGGGAQSDKALSGAIQGLGDVIGRQRQLLDKSLREGQGAGDPRDGGGRGLANQQGKLREDLGRLEKGLNGQKLPGQDSLGEAEREMGNAQNALGSQSFDEAGQAQKNALEALKEGAGRLAQELAKQNGQSGSGRQDEDPLGRAAGAMGGAGSDTRLPNQTEMQRARAILQELRRRASQPGRPKEELDYIDRLLRQF
ncbi:MAG TPA: TIGR02302 family protein [Rhizomicrobium sp.]|jgi:uncharacterized protein (TIGR02302 family)